MTMYIILLCSILLGVLGQILLKFAAVGESTFWIIDPFINNYFFIALVIYFLSVILYTVSLREIPLHIAFPCVSISYVLVAFISSKIWDTPFGSREILAFALIMLAIWILASSQSVS